MTQFDWADYTKEFAVFTPQFRSRQYNQMNFSHQHGQRVVDDYFSDLLFELGTFIEHDLNVYERKHPRRDPKMQFTTDEWRVECRMIYEDRSRSTLEVKCTNYQDPYRYPGKSYVIGNLAAVRLDQHKGVVTAKKFPLMWWYNGKYIFRQSRRKSASGHKRYKRALDNIIVRNVRRMIQ